MGTSHTRARLDFVGGGEVAYYPPGRRYAVRIHVEYKPTPARWVVDEVHFTAFRVTARDLRDLPLGKIEVWVNQLAQQGLLDPIKGVLTDTVDFGDPAEGRISWIPQPPPAPVEGAKGDEFYRRVGEIYAKAALASPRPAADLAEAWDVPLSTVHRWVRVARRRGHLPPTEKGRKA
jgi:hypothetical protein